MYAGCIVRKRILPTYIRYYQETRSYSRISLRKPSTTENIIIRGSRRKFAQVKFQRQAKETRSQNTMRDIYSRWPPFFFERPKCAKLFTNLETSQKLSILMTFMKIFSWKCPEIF